MVEKSMPQVPSSWHCVRRTCFVPSPSASTDLSSCTHAHTPRSSTGKGVPGFQKERPSAESNPSIVELIASGQYRKFTPIGLLAGHFCCVGKEYFMRQSLNMMRKLIKDGVASLLMWRCLCDGRPTNSRMTDTSLSVQFKH